MTTIAWSGTEVAADSQVTYGSCRGAGNVTKLKQRGSAVYACTGHAALFDPMIAWVENGADPDQRPKIGDEKSTALLVFRSDKCLMYKTDVPYREEMAAPDAWGSGAEYASGAMRAGASAAEAVKIAIACDVNSGGPVQVIDLNSMDDIKPIPPEALAEMRQLAKEVDLNNAIRLLEEAGYDIRHPDGEDCGFGRCGICNAALVDDFGCRRCKDRNVAWNAA